MERWGVVFVVVFCEVISLECRLHSVNTIVAMTTGERQHVLFDVFNI